MRIFLAALLISLVAPSTHAQSIDGNQNNCNIVLNAASSSQINLTCEGIPDEALQQLQNTLNGLDASASVMLTIANNWAKQYATLERRAEELAASNALAAQALEKLRQGQLESANLILSTLTDLQPTLARIDRATAETNERTAIQLNEQRRNYLVGAITFGPSWHPLTNIHSGGWQYGGAVYLTQMWLSIYPSASDLDTDLISYSLKIKDRQGRTLLERSGETAPKSFIHDLTVTDKLTQFDVILEFCASWTDRFLGQHVLINYTYQTHLERLKRINAAYKKGYTQGSLEAGGVESFVLAEDPAFAFTDQWLKCPAKAPEEQLISTN